MSTANLPRGTVLLTGANGFAAVHILEALLTHGYSVVGTVRSESKIKYLQDKFGETGRVKFAIVEDITKPGAFDKVLKENDFTAVLHTSSPFHFNVKDIRKELYEPARVGTVGILQSLHENAKSVKRVVILASFACIVDRKKGARPEHTYTSADWNPLTEEGGLETPNTGYTASKKLAEQAAWHFMETEKPSFTLTTLCPPMIFGPPEQEVESLDKLNTSCLEMYNYFSGKKEPANTTWIWVDVRDVAQAHVGALESADAPGKRYLVTAGNYSAQQFLDFIYEHYPDRAAEKGIKRGTPGQLWPEGGVYKADNSPSEKELGVQYRAFDVMLKDTFEKFASLEKDPSVTQASS